jgi:hypothetical protein
MRIFVIALAMSGPAMAQIQPPAVDLPDSSAPLPTTPTPQGYPSTLAQTAQGTYLAGPAWNQKLAPNVRFVILSNFGNEAVLDRETGLVWARQSVEPASWGRVFSTCAWLNIGDRGGWRMPKFAELQSLLDYSTVPPLVGAGFPVGHPFMVTLDSNPIRRFFWTADQYPPNAGSGVQFLVLNMAFGFEESVVSTNEYGTLCVRGAP